MMREDGGQKIMAGVERTLPQSLKLSASCARGREPRCSAFRSRPTVASIVRDGSRRRSA